MSDFVHAEAEAGSPKRRKILAGAREVFMGMGFERASVDEISARAGVSKATVYNHFQDKSALFVACFSEESDALRAGFLRCLGEPEGNVEDALQRVGERIAGIILAPGVVALYRHTSAETERFPEIGRMIFERGPAVVHEHLARYLVRWAERGDLRIEDPRSAAVQLIALCKGDLHVRALLGILEYPADEQIEETVRRAVHVFVKAYRP